MTVAATALAAAGGGPGRAEPSITRSYSAFGTPGLVDMPTAEMAPDGELAGTYGQIAGQTRAALTFQITPRLSGSFRYSVIPDFDGPGQNRYDRSFDLGFALVDEGRIRPAVVVGLRDFIGTGLYSSEYVAATKGIGPGGALRVTAGLGWGRLATRNEVFRTDAERVEVEVVTGGTANLETLFSGPVAAFAGARWRASDRLSFAVEYSSDAYTDETARGLIAPQSPWNIGLDYEVARGVRLSAFAVQGSEVGLQVAFTLNPLAPPAGPGLDPAPLPVQQRPPRSVDALGWSGAWAADAATTAARRAALAAALAGEGIVLDGAAIGPEDATLRIVNTRWSATAQSIGRTARAMARELPASVERFTIVTIVDGTPHSAVRLTRSDVENLETAPAEAILARATVNGGTGGTGASGENGPEMIRLQPYPRFASSLGPFLELSLFDPDQPVRYAAGLQLTADLDLGPGVEISGALRQPVLGTLDEITRESNSVLPRVRSDFARYVDDFAPRLERLTISRYGRPGDATYSRVSAGYLERMFAGLSGEVLWKPADRRLALGLEVNAVRQRAFDDPFGLQDYEVVTGHASLYSTFGNGFFGQLDVGRYLAGDDGATVSLDRVFGNGWRVGAYATFTDVPFEDFGEGSFDKGIRLVVPLQWLTGIPTRSTFSTVVQPVTRDGGARLNVANRLYPRVAGDHLPAIRDRSGRFWK